MERRFRCRRRRLDYIGVRCTVIAPNVAPIGLSEPHVGASPRERPSEQASSAEPLLAAMSAMPDN